MSDTEKSKLTPVMIRHIIDTAEKMKYGKIIIDLNDHLKTVDITTEIKNRFEKEPGKGC